MTAFYTLVLFILWTILVKVVDTAAIGPMNTVVGFSSLNGPVHNALGTSEMWYSASQILGYLAILLAAVFAGIGAVQLIQRKSLAKVDKKLLAAGIIYICVIIAYILFDKVVVNCRPVIMPDETAPEPSYPSTHAMIGCVSYGIGAILLPEYLKNRKLAAVVRPLCWILAGLTVIFRLLSGVHWLTDIIGGVIISAFFLALFAAVCRKIDYLERKNKKQ